MGGFQEGCGASCSSFRTSLRLRAKMECCRSRADEGIPGSSHLH